MYYLYISSFCKHSSLSSMSSSDLSKVKYMNLVETDIQAFTAEQEKKHAAFIKEFGKDKFYDIVYYGKQHHPLRASRTVGYNLTEEEKKELLSKGFLNKDSHGQTFEKCYEELYNNDMPVLVTSDSLLSAFHKF